jgi:hypothetical protein
MLRLRFNGNGGVTIHAGDGKHRTVGLDTHSSQPSLRKRAVIQVGALGIRAITRNDGLIVEMTFATQKQFGRKIQLDIRKSPRSLWRVGCYVDDEAPSVYYLRQKRPGCSAPDFVFGSAILLHVNDVEIIIQATSGTIKIRIKLTSRMEPRIAA